MFDSFSLMLADTTQPAADEVPYKPNAPAIGPASEQSGSTTTVTQGTTGTASTQPLGGSQPQQPTSLFGSMQSLLLMVAIIGVMFWVMGASQRKEKKKRASMLAALKKGDKVQTIGGVIASVVEVREHDVVLKVDDDTRIRFTRGAIQNVLDDKPEDTAAL